MKSYLKSLICLLLAAFMAPVLLTANNTGDYYGLPGDDFSLEGALDLFKRSNSLEEFERDLNSPECNVNNLDLNNNGRIDYLRVVDHAEGDLHAIVIQALIDNGLSQDVAVIEVKRNRHGEAVVQIVGDEDLYGTAKIVEPYPYDDMAGPDYYDNYSEYYSPTVYVNAWSWPSVRFIFAPRYVVWVSPFYYDYYPLWYSAWRPQPYHVWYSHTVVYHHHYCVAPNYRNPEVHHYYGARRVYAPVVHQRTEQYVAENGGRANFNHSKRNASLENPSGRSLDRSEKLNMANRSERQLEQTPSVKPNTSDRNLDRNQKPETVSTKPKADVVPRTERQREQAPVAKSPDVSRKPEAAPSKPKTDLAPRTDRPREQAPVTKSPEINRRPETAPTKSKAETSTRPSVSPKRDAAPRSNNATAEQGRSTKSSPQVAPRSDRKPAPSAAPKASRSESSSRSSGKATSSKGTSSQSSKPAVASERSQARKGKG